jgi:S-adenosylmethionine/arginine decarboxylase-like enzyme
MPYEGPQLGARMHSMGVVLHGSLSNDRWLELLNEIARAIGMTAVGEAKVWDYPLEGKGGTGQTIVLPITESFLALDTWRDHSGAYLFVCSCRPYYSADIDAVAASFGLKVSLSSGRRFYHELNLK